jgi:predicted DNA-binding ribbon-helix-helix protein
MSKELTMAKSRLVNRNVTMSSHRTSMRMEPEMWDAMQDICRRENIPTDELIRQAETAAGEGGRSSAVRIYVLEYYRAAAATHGHIGARHGSAQEHEHAM